MITVIHNLRTVVSMSCNNTLTWPLNRADSVQQLKVKGSVLHVAIFVSTGYLNGGIGSSLKHIHTCECFAGFVFVHLAYINSHADGASLLMLRSDVYFLCGLGLTRMLMVESITMNEQW